MRKDTCNIGLFIVTLLATLAPSPAIANQDVLVAQPTTARRWFKDQYGHGEKPQLIVNPGQNPYTVDILGFYLLQCLDEGDTKAYRFQDAVTLWCDGYKLLTSKDFSVRDSKQAETFRKALLETKTGQQYLRFPRISRRPDGTICKRYPFPSLYGMEKSSYVINKNHRDFAAFDERLNFEHRRVGQEIAIFGCNLKTFDWERVEVNPNARPWD